MKRHRKNNNHGKRSQTGAAMVLGTLLIVLFFIIAIPMIMFFFNFSTQMLHQNQLACIAADLASYCVEEDTWLGLKRPNAIGVKQDEVAENARTMCGLIGIKNVRTKIDSFTQADGRDAFTCTLTGETSVPFDLPLFGQNFKKLFPGKITASAKSAASQVRPYAMVKFDGQIIDDNDTKRTRPDKERLICYLPCYGFSREGETTEAANLGAPYSPLGMDNNQSINCHPFNQDTLTYFGIDNDSTVARDKQHYPAYFHPDMFGDGTKFWFNKK